MKLKTVHIYVGVVILAVIALIIFTPGDTNKNTATKAPLGNDQMPQDEVHKGITPPGNGSPSGANVSEAVKHQMEILKKQYETNPDDTLKAREYAEFLAAAHKPDEAVTIFERILKKDPRRTDIRFSLAFIFYNKQNLQKAEEIIRGVLSYDKKNPQAKYNLGAIAASRGEIDKAISNWEEVIKENPNTELSRQAAQSIQTLRK